ncbi:MAG: glycosyltransferase family 2 protein [Xanthomonadales bacterium]|nr:glycosyltransferase family 2 protein [Xanthomonadales bacterium]
MILTLNEETNIGRCLAALDWSDDVVVLDSFSADRTVELAKQMGARVYQRTFDDFAGQRNYALDEIDFVHDWILHLDADEVVTEDLRNEMAQSVARGHYPAYRIAGKLMFNGRWLRHAGMYPTYQVRLGRKDDLRFRQAGHGQRETLNGEQIGTLSNGYLHYGFSKGLADWIARHNRYASQEARTNLAQRTALGSGSLGILSSDRTVRRRAVKVLAARLPFRPFLRFVYMYLLKLGFLDGSAGLTYCRMMAMYEYWIVLQERELRRQAGS